MAGSETARIEIALLLEAIYLQYGFDFRDYSRSHVARRIKRFMASKGIKSVAWLQHEVLHVPEVFEELLMDFSVAVTEMFRDPAFYQVLLREVFPVLKTYPLVKIWHAGCSSGEEVYSLAILLKEAGLYPKVQIYATDINERVLERARNGSYPVNRLEGFSASYTMAGGKKSLSDYYTLSSGFVVLDPALRARTIFTSHNLARDQVFGEMNLVLCRNVLVYFTKPLINRVIRLFRESLCPGGFICLGAKESLRSTDYLQYFDIYSGEQKIYRKKYL